MQISQYKTSYSALETFKQCPQKYKFQQIDRIKATKNKDAVFGSKIHDALKFFHSQRPVSPTLDELLNYFKDIWPDLSANGTSELFQSQQEDMIYFNEGIKVLRKYYMHFLKNRDNFTILDTESRFEIPIKHPKTSQICTLVGKIDRIDKCSNGQIEVIDYKTTKKLPPQIVVDKNLQLSLYCLAVFLRWPNLNKNIEDIKLSFHFLKHGEILSTRRTKSQLEDVKNEVWNKIYEIEKKEFKPIPSVLCDWCGYKNICPMWKHKHTKEKAPDDQEIQKVIKEFFELKAQNKNNNKKLTELKQKVNNYLDNKKLERVFGINGYITRLSQTRYKYDFEKIKQALEPIGKWNDVLIIDSRKLSKISKNLPIKIKRQIKEAKKKDKEYIILKAKLEKNKNST